MQIKVTGHGLEITAPLRDYAVNKVAKLEEFYKNIQKVEVILDARDTNNSDKRQVAEIRAYLGGSRTLLAKEAGQDMYAAIDLALGEIKRQVEKQKDKLVHEKRRESKKIKLLSRLKFPGIPFFGSSGR